jgi:hypothetical protein
MKKYLLSCVFLLLGSTWAVSGFMLHSKNENNPNGFAVVELFTSEGCSSCPPAESVLHPLINGTKAQPYPVVILEFHVDYWDYLEWKDTFADVKYSQRQQVYGDFLKLSSIYTPQDIINGVHEMVGSYEDKIKSVIAQELQNPVTAHITCTARKKTGADIAVHYSIQGDISHCELHIAVIESGLTTYIKKGENARRTLTHDNVVRVFKTIQPDLPGGVVTMNLSHIRLANASLVCYLQNHDNMQITGVVKTSIE